MHKKTILFSHALRHLFLLLPALDLPPDVLLLLLLQLELDPLHVLLLVSAQQLSNQLREII